jgi:hypothetical protein
MVAGHTQSTQKFYIRLLRLIPSIPPAAANGFVLLGWHTSDSWDKMGGGGICWQPFPFPSSHLLATIECPPGQFLWPPATGSSDGCLRGRFPSSPPPSSFRSFLSSFCPPLGLIAFSLFFCLLFLFHFLSMSLWPWGNCCLPMAWPKRQRL